jgi:uridine phosphorylase
MPARGRGVPPILEYDPDRAAIIDPAATQAWHDAPAAGVACFLHGAIPEVFPEARELVRLPSLLPLWEVRHRGRRVGVFYPGQGAALAATTLERVLAGGCKAVVACGGAGTIDRELESGQIVVVDAAVRDEGTSYHYLPAAREVRARPQTVAALDTAALRRGISTIRAKTWTTDGLFRQTPARLERRLREGCVLADMEAAALLAVGEFRNVPVGIYLSAGDQIVGPRPEQSSWRSNHEAHRALIRLAADAALDLSRLHESGSR